MMEYKDENEFQRLLLLLVNMFLDTGIGSVPFLGTADGKEEESMTIIVGMYVVGTGLIFGSSGAVVVRSVDAKGDDEDSSLVTMVAVALEEGDGDESTSAPTATVDALNVTSALPPCSAVVIIIVGAFVPVQSPSTSPRSSVPNMVGATLLVITSSTALLIVLVPCTPSSFDSVT